jgi:hypothetical protein
LCLSVFGRLPRCARARALRPRLREGRGAIPFFPAPGFSHHTNERNNYAYIYGAGNSSCFLIDRLIEIFQMQRPAASAQSALWTFDAYEQCIRFHIEKPPQRLPPQRYGGLSGRRVRQRENRVGGNAGTLSLNDYRKVFDQSRKFRAWSRNIESRSLIGAYIDELNQTPLLERLPSIYKGWLPSTFVSALEANINPAPK